MFHAGWGFVRKYPWLITFLTGVAIAAGVVGLDYCITATENRLISLHVQPTGTDRLVRDMRQLPFYAHLAGGSFSLGCGVALAGIYFMIRARIREYRQQADSPSGTSKESP